MAYQHDAMAHRVSELLLKQLRTGEADPWAPDRLTEQASVWSGISDWPRPDFAFQDVSENSSVAGEFKPPGHERREYVTGLGQCFTYLESFEYALLVAPMHSKDGFEIGHYLGELIDNQLDPAPVGVMAYAQDPGDASGIEVVKSIPERVGQPPGIPTGMGKNAFWAYWRDLSHYDLFSILTYVEDSSTTKFDEAYKKFWDDKMVTGSARKWEGDQRKATDRDADSYPAKKRNAYYTTRHLGLIDSDDRLTSRGLKLLQTGKIYEVDSTAFYHLLASYILERGKHLELIFWVEDTQHNISEDAKRTRNDFNQAIDSALQAEGVKMKENDGEGKTTFFRDEPKLWNKLNLLHHYEGRAKQYFHPGVGFRFNWKQILEILS